MSEDMWDDDVADAVALVAAARREDMKGVAAIIGNASLPGVCITLVKLLGEAADEGRATPAHFRKWAAQAAMRRGSDNA